MAQGLSNQDFHMFSYRDFTDKVEIWNGEFGAVYGARHHLFRKVAIRIVSRQYHVSQGEQNLLLNEAKKLFSIVSENVIRFLGTVIEPEHLCLVFEYAEYGSLDKLLVRFNIPWALKLRMSHEVAMGMSFLHQKDILHLLLKCTNVLVTGNVQCKITDICLRGNREMNNWTRHARMYSQTLQLTRTRPPGSSIGHIPPELIRDVNASPDKSSDVYAYSIVIWQILTNKTPYEGKTSDEICEAVVHGERPDTTCINHEHPGVLSEVMKQCWQDHKRNRPTFDEVVRQIGVVATKCEDAARNAALECQNNVQDFYFPVTPLAAPTGDQHPLRSRNIGRPDAPAHIGAATNAIDGFPIPMRTDDETTRPSSLQPKQVLPLINPTNHSERNVNRTIETPAVENKIPPIPTANPTLSEEKSSKLVSIEELYLVAEELGRNWRRFGLHLGFSDAQLDNIESNFHRHGFPEITYQMLRRWKEQSGTVTVGYLFNTLKNANLLHVAQKLAE